MKKALSLGLLVFLAACSGDNEEQVQEGPPPPEPLTAATLGEQQVLSNTEFLATEPYAGADLELGERQAQICLACHSLEEGGRTMIGPNLHGFFGQTAGVSDAFEYSQVLAGAGFTWTPRALDAWLAQPARFLPGNRMSFPGVRNAEDRANLIAYLLKETDSSSQE